MYFEFLVTRVLPVLSIHPRHAEEEILAMKNALAGTDARLSLVETLEADVLARGEELKTCHEEMLLREEEIKKERSRAQHLVRGHI